jgi:hypothetical protein
VHSITAVYSGDSIFSAGTSSTLTQTVVDYAVSSLGVSAQTIPPDQSATYTVAVTPTEGTDLPAAATLTVTGLPSGATASLTTASWTRMQLTPELRRVQAYRNAEIIFLILQAQPGYRFWGQAG